MNRQVEGALIDSYVVSTQKDLSSNPNLRVYQVYDYQKTYGVVLAGVSMKLEKCFLDIAKLNKADITHKIEEIVNNPTVIKLRTVTIFSQPGDYENNFEKVTIFSMQPPCLCPSFCTMNNVESTIIIIRFHLKYHFLIILSYI